MLKLLLKTRFDMFFGSVSQGKRKKTASPLGKVMLILLFAFLAIYFTAVITILFVGIGRETAGTDAEYSIFALAVLVSIGITLFDSIFTVKTQIYESKDNELLLSLPIEPKYIFISRLLFLFIVNYLLEAVVMLPAMVIYGILIGYNVLGFVYSVVIFLAIPLLTLSLSSFIAWIVSVIASKIKNKTLVTTVLFAGAFGAYMYLISVMGPSSDMEEGTIDMSRFKDMFLIGWGAKAMTYGDTLSFVLFIAACIIPAILAYVILNKTFIKLITVSRGTVKTKYKEKAEKAEGVFIALVKKELKRFVSSSMYMINSGMGIVMMVVFTVMLCVTGNEMFAEIDGVDLRFLAPAICFALLALGSSMILISTPSISLEDRNLWIVQSLPVRGAHALLAKVSSHMIISTPFIIICSLILSIGFKISVINSILLLVSSVVTSAFFAYFGMLLGLLFPKFDWQNENVAVKQGFAIFGSMFGGMVWALLISGIVVILSFISFIIGAIAVTLLNAGMCVAIHMYFLKKGEKRFALLKQ